MRFRYIRFFEQLSRHDLGLAGGKGANLGELTQAGIPVPPGFVVLSTAYSDFLTANSLRPHIHKILSVSNPNDPHELSTASSRIRHLVLSAPIPSDITGEVFKSYHHLTQKNASQAVAIRSSATAEDLPEASFAGQQSSFLNITGDANVLLKVKECWASLFEERSIFYRVQKKIDHFQISMAVPVQVMVQSEISGVMFTVDPVTHNKQIMVIEAVYGLGDYIVQGVVTPDHYEVDKSTHTIFSKQISTQEKMEIRSATGVKAHTVPPRLRSLQKLSDQHILELSHIGDLIQKHYYFPQDIEWAMVAGKIYITQSRPITTLNTNDQKSDLGQLEQLGQLKSILKGAPASPGLISGPVRLVTNIKKIGEVKSGEIMVTHMTTPDFVPAMKKSAAIITDQGGLTSHAAIISRELGVPCVVGTLTATSVLITGQLVTVNGTTGEVFAGALNLKSKILHSQPNPKLQTPNPNLKTATKIYVNLAQPDQAQKVADAHVDGVGLLRAEFMMTQIGIHPKKALADGKQKHYISQMVDGLVMFAKAFYPRPVIYRASDFRTNEFRGLKGGDTYEPHEENPMLGFRGATRYIADPHVFELELAAIKLVRATHRLSNLHLMLPFVRSPEELLQVKKIIASAGLVRSNHFHLWMMVELPVNVIRLDEFIDVGIDGISIGSNDLTMLILGVDRDNTEIAHSFNELDPAVLWALERTIRTCVKRGITSSLCGQAATNHPDLASHLVKWGVTSISVAPDAVTQTRQIVHDCELKLIKHGYHH